MNPNIKTALKATGLLGAAVGGAILLSACASAPPEPPQFDPDCSFSEHFDRFLMAHPGTTERGLALSIANGDLSSAAIALTRVHECRTMRYTPEA